MKLRNIIISALALTVASCGQTENKNIKTDTMNEETVGIDVSPISA